MILLPQPAKCVPAHQTLKSSLYLEERNDYLLDIKQRKTQCNQFFKQNVSSVSLATSTENKI